MNAGSNGRKNIPHDSGATCNSAIDSYVETSRNFGLPTVSTEASPDNSTQLDTLNESSTFEQDITAVHAGKNNRKFKRSGRVE